ncbi:hypothetical protein Vretimale_15400, partial [Volvox reticuliferus]
MQSIHTQSMSLIAAYRTGSSAFGSGMCAFLANCRSRRRTRFRPSASRKPQLPPALPYSAFRCASAKSIGGWPDSATPAAAAASSSSGPGARISSIAIATPVWSSSRLSDNLNLILPLAEP